MSQAIIMAGTARGLHPVGSGHLALDEVHVLAPILEQGDKALFNPYGIISVSPAKWPSTNIEGARALIAWMTGNEGRAAIAAYTIGGERCFDLY